jgi:hypothetical protein
VLVEAAFVIPILLVLILGVIDFAWLFNQYISVRQGVREAARQAAVDTIPQPSSGTWTGSPNNCVLDTAAGSNFPPSGNAAYQDVQDLMCYAKARVGLGNNVRISIYYNNSDSNGVYTPNTIPTDPDAVIICAQYQVQSLTGAFGPILGNYTINAQTEIRIENESGSVGGTTYGDLTAYGAAGTSPGPPFKEPPYTSWPSACTTL